MLEQEISQLERDLASRRLELEKQKQSGEIAEVPHEKETLRQVIKERLRVGQSSQAQIPNVSQQPATSNQLPAAGYGSPSYLSAELKDKVQELIDIAFTKSLDEAVKLARQTNNAALIDAFHDALADELYSHLVERGRLKKL